VNFVGRDVLGCFAASMGLSGCPSQVSLGFISVSVSLYEWICFFAGDSLAFNWKNFGSPVSPPAASPGFLRVIPPPDLLLPAPEAPPVTLHWSCCLFFFAVFRIPCQKLNVDLGEIPFACDTLVVR